MKVDFNRSELTVANPICCIYAIVNTLFGMIYIGQTVDLRKRLNVYENLENKEDCDRKSPIARAIKEYGNDNFTMYILERCKPEELAEKENFYIQKYQSDDPDIGYNAISYNVESANSEESRRKKSESHKGLKESADTKRKKSNPIFAVVLTKDENGKFTGDIIHCDSAKLFGDFVGSSKDVIKNCLRGPSRYKGYRLYYGDFEKRNEIRNKMIQKGRRIRDREYLEILPLIDRYDIKGVETMSEDLHSYILSYDYCDEHGKPFLVPYNPPSKHVHEPIQVGTEN